MRKTRDWRDGRQVIRRLEARGSVMDRLYLPLTVQEMKAVAECLRETVERRKAMTQEERDAEILAIAELDRRRR